MGGAQRRLIPFPTLLSCLHSQSLVTCWVLENNYAWDYSTSIDTLGWLTIYLKLTPIGRIWFSVMGVKHSIGVARVLPKCPDILGVRLVISGGNVPLTTGSNVRIWALYENPRWSYTRGVVCCDVEERTRRRKCIVSWNCVEQSSTTDNCECFLWSRSTMKWLEFTTFPVIRYFDCTFLSDYYYYVLCGCLGFSVDLTL